MSNKTHYDVKARTIGLSLISGSFAPAGVGAPTALKGRGISSVVRTGVGTYLVTFDEPYFDLVSAQATLQLNAAADSDVQFGAYDPVAKTLVVRIQTAGAVADIAANANNRVNFNLVFKNSGA